MRSFPQHGHRHASPFLTVLRWGMVAVCLWSIAPEVRSQGVDIPSYREITPYQADLVGTPSWAQSGRPGILGAELTVPANTFLRNIAIRMAESPNAKGGFELHLFRIPRRSSTGGMDHVAQLKGTDNPAAAGLHLYEIPAGLVLSGRYLLVAMVSPGGGTYRWTIETAAEGGTDGSVFYGVLAVPGAPTTGGSNVNTNGGSNGSTLVWSGASGSIWTGATLTLANPTNWQNPPSITFGPPVRPPSTGGNFLLNPQISSGSTFILGGNTSGGTTSGNQTTLGGSSTVIRNDPPPVGTILGSNPGSLPPLNFQIPTSNPTQTLNPTPVPSPLISPTPGLVINRSGETLTYQGGTIQPTQAGPVSSSEESSEEQTASAFLSASSEVAAAQEDLPRLMLLPALDETGRFAFTLRSGSADSLLQVQRPRPFSPVAVGAEGPTQRIRIRNVAETAIQGLSIHASGETKRHFRVTTTPRRSLAKGESTEFLLTAAPKRPGVRRGIIEVRSEAGSEFLVVTVRGVRGVFSPRAGMSTP
ncbi:MAG: hypothetical protein JNJ70_07980 [Verrucomicrobiales bacterium]|nr:hypothetical protein [Verrucomicrobiales bacterium]